MNTRENDFLEAAALGNARAVSLYLTATPNPVDINTQNSTNGWSALHWAAKRSHADVIKILLASKADVRLRNQKGQLPGDLATDPECKRLLGVVNDDAALSAAAADAAAGEEGVAGGDAANKEADSATAASAAAAPEDGEKFVPNYIRNPDLLKSWSIPDEFHGLPAASNILRDSTANNNTSSSSSKRRSSVEKQPTPLRTTSSKYALADQAAIAQGLIHGQPELPPPLLITPASNAQNVHHNDKHEIIVYVDTPENPSNLLGAVFVSPADTMWQTLQQIKSELDGVPEMTSVPVTVLRVAAEGRLVPIGKRQMGQRTWMHFKGKSPGIMVLREEEEPDVPAVGRQKGKEAAAGAASAGLW